MTARREPYRSTNKEWACWTEEEKKAHNKREEDRIRACMAEDDAELLRRIDAAGPAGYRIPEYDANDPSQLGMRMLQASLRLSSNPHKHQPNLPIMEREPWVFVRRKGRVW